jgi:hypothetical protein
MQIFLSHATADQHIAHEIRTRLGHLGVSVYLAEHDNQAGESLADKVTAALLASDLAVALLTPSGFSSVFVHQEMALARGAGKIVIPLVDRTIPNLDLGLFTGVEYIVLDPAHPAEALESLSERVAAIAQAQAERAALAAIAEASDDAARRQKERDAVLALLAVSAVLVAAGVYFYYTEG